jgi:cellulose synthase (UDP-forming)
MQQWWHHLVRIPGGQVRDIVLVLLGILALGFYYSWWFQAGRLSSPWLVLAFIAALFYTVMQLLSSWLVYLAAHYDVARPRLQKANLTVDVFVTASGEEYALFGKVLLAARAMRGSHRTWLLDDGNDPVLAQLARHLGVGYLTRQGRKDAKAGGDPPIPVSMAWESPWTTA